MHGKLISQKYQQRHLTLLPNTFVFQNTAKFSCMYVTVQIIFCIYFSRRVDYTDLTVGESWLVRK